MYIYEKLVTKVVIVFAIIIVSLSVYMAIMLPVQLYHGAKCIEAGYPKSYVTYNLKGYCINLDGSVTAKVIPIEDIK